MPLTIDDYYQAYRQGDTARAARIQETLKQSRPVVPDLSKIPSKHIDASTKASPQPNTPTPPRSREQPRPSNAEPPATARTARTAPAPVRSPVQVAVAEPPKPLKLGLNLPLALPPAIPQAVKPAGIGAGVTAAIDFPVRVISGQSVTQAAVGASGSAVGTFAGGVVGALAGPFGMYVGGAIGGLIGGAIADWIYDKAAPKRGEGVPEEIRSGPIPFTGGQSPKVPYHGYVYLLAKDGSIWGNRELDFGVLEGPITGVFSEPTADPDLKNWFITNAAGQKNYGVTNGSAVAVQSIRIIRNDGLPDTGGNLLSPIPVDIRNPSTRSHPLAQPTTTSSGQAVVGTEAAAVPGGLKNYEGSSPRGDSPTWVPHGGLKGSPNPSTVPQNLGHDFPDLEPQPGDKAGGVPLSQVPGYAEPEPPQPLDIAPLLPPDTDVGGSTPNEPKEFTIDPLRPTVEALKRAKKSATQPLQDAIDFWQKVNPEHPAIKQLEATKLEVEEPYDREIQDYQKRFKLPFKITVKPGTTGLPSEVENKLIQLGTSGSLEADLNALDPRLNTIRSLEAAAASAVQSIDAGIKVWDRKLGENNPYSQQLKQQRQALLEPFEKQVQEAIQTLKLTPQDLETYEKTKRFLEDRYNLPPLPNLTQKAQQQKQAIPDPVSNGSGKFQPATNPLTKTIPLIPALVRPAITPTGNRLTRPDAQPKAPDYSQPGTTCEFDPCLAGLQRKSQENGNKLDRLLDGANLAGTGAGALANQAGINEILKRLDKMDAKLGPQIPNGGLSGFLTNAFKGVGRLADFFMLDRILNALTFLTVLHNAYFLSNALTQTLFEAVSNVLAAVGIRNSEGEPINVNAIVTRYLDNFAKQMFGVATVDGIKDAWKKYSRIYQAASNLLFSMTSILWSLQEVLEIIGENVNRIGNALKKWGVVGERAYGWMTEKMSKVGRFGRFEQAIQGVTEVTDNVSEIAANVVDAQESVAMLDNQTRDLQTAIASDSPKTQIENTPLKEEADRLKDFSQSPLITIDDEIKPEI